MTGAEGFRPPPYPYDRLDDLKALADSHVGVLVDLSVGTPSDPPASDVLKAMDGHVIAKAALEGRFHR